MTTHEQALRALAQAYDREDAAQRGEPDPWNLDDPGDIGDSDTWVSERLACAEVAARAFLDAIGNANGVWQPLPTSRRTIAMRELPRDLVTILRTEAKNQRTPPIDYVVAEDGGRMVHRPDPDIAMAELLEEAATALTTERSAHAEARKALDALDRMSRGVDWCDQDEQARRWSAARRALINQPSTEGGMDD